MQAPNVADDGNFTVSSSTSAGSGFGVSFREKIKFKVYFRWLQFANVCVCFGFLTSVRQAKIK